MQGAGAETSSGRTFGIQALELETRIQLEFAIPDNVGRSPVACSTVRVVKIWYTKPQ